jgi:hypothetical protein
MKRLLNAVLCLSLLVVSAGCSICQGPDDYGYATYGGRWQRMDRQHGRVGSRFTPEAGTRVEVTGDMGDMPTEVDLYPADYAPDYAPEPPSILE